MASFELALQEGADAIELDAKLTADGEIIVMHDASVDRTTDGHGRVSELSLAAIRKLDAGSSFGVGFLGEPVPTLSEVLERFGDRTLINIELTNYSTPHDDLVERVAALVGHLGLVERVLFSSFRAANLSRMSALIPQATVAILANPGPLGWSARGRAGRRVASRVVHPYKSDVPAGYVRRQHAAGRRVHVWTVDDGEEMRALFDRGVDGIFTDDPALGRRVLAG